MSAKGLFTRGFTKAEVEKILASAKAQLMEGKTIMSWNDGGTSVTKQQAMPVTEVLEECQYALRYFEQQETESCDSEYSGSLSHVAWRLPH